MSDYASLIRPTLGLGLFLFDEGIPDQQQQTYGEADVGDQCAAGEEEAQANRVAIFRAEHDLRQ
jgi:hypothetical protein